jgi:hypothetical protein
VKRIIYHLKTLVGAGLLLQAMVTLICIALIAWNRTDVDIVRILLVTYLEVFLPFVGALISTLSLPEDAMIEILFALPMSSRQMISEKLSLSGVLIAGSALLVTGLTFLLCPPIATSVNPILTWFSPTLFLMGVGMSCSVITSSPRTSASIVGLLWILEIMFKGEILSSPLGEATFLFLTWQMPDSNLWGINRLVLCALGIITLWFALKKIDLAEPFLKSSE